MPVHMKTLQDKHTLKNWESTYEDIARQAYIEKLRMVYENFLVIWCS